MSADPVDELRRWEQSGGGWRVVGRAGGGITVALLTCDGGEEMGRLASYDAAFLAYVGGRAASDD